MWRVGSDGSHRIDHDGDELFLILLITISPILRVSRRS